MTNTTAVAVRDMGALIEKNAAALQSFLPDGVTIERVVGLVKLEVYKNPALAACEPASVFDALARICSWGAEVGREAYLVPFKDRASGTTKCTPVPDYKWLAGLAVRAGGARAIEAHVVYDGEDFEIAYGSEKRITHRPAFSAKGRGVIMGAYAIAWVGFGQWVAEWIPVEDLEAHRAKYSKQWSKGPMEPWWAKKTAVLRLIKLLPKSAKMTEVLRVVDDTDAVDTPDSDPDSDGRPAIVDPSTGEVLDDDDS